MNDIRSATTALSKAFATRMPIPPISQTWPAVTIKDAYGIQRALAESWVRGGDPVRGHKIGLVSAAIREQMGVREPDFGHLTASMFRLATMPLFAEEFIQPRVEPEIAVILGRDLRGPGLTVADAARAVELVLPALEIVDSRIEDWNLTIRDTVADNASSGAVVLGADAVPLAGLDLTHLVCALSRNGRVVDHGVGAAVCGSPLYALTWLANMLGALGVPLEAGHIVLTGSFTRAVPVLPGDTVTVDFHGLGAVSLTMLQGRPDADGLTPDGLPHINFEMTTPPAPRRPA